MSLLDLIEKQRIYWNSYRKVFDLALAAASTGLSERAVQSLGYKHAVVHTTGKDHAGYYPGATDIVLKLIFSPTDGKIFERKPSVKRY